MQATSYDDWRAAATSLDDIEGNNEWKTIFESPEYDAELVQTRLEQLDEARISCDVGRMLFLVRTSLTRGMGGMLNLSLYKHCHIGTKELIERYITSALKLLDALLDVSAKAKCDTMESKYILEQLLSARQAFGRSALLLSGGGTFGMTHIGVLKALYEARLLPRIISGSSAGSIICAVLCTRTDEEIPGTLSNLSYDDLAVFEEEGNEDSILRKTARFLKHGSLFDISHLIRVLRELLGEMTFQEAYNRTRRILNICVSSASLYELPRLLNYVTAPNVVIWSAVAASCSVPLIFSAASLLAKDPKTGEAAPWNPSAQRWIDGSVDGDIPMTRLAEMFNVNHFIVSQVNPHVVPFLAKEEDSIMQEAQKASSIGVSGPTWLTNAGHLAKSEALHRMHILVDMGVFPNTLTKVISVLSQKYSGDITIMPEVSYADFPRILKNPTTEFMLQATLCGERATWPKLSRIRNHCAIELALDDAIQRLRERVVFSPSQVDLRLGHARLQAVTKKAGRIRARTGQRSLSQASAPVASHSNRSRRIRNTRATRARTFKIPDYGPVPINTMRQPNPSPFTVLVHPARTAPVRDTLTIPDLTSSGAETSYLPTSASSSSSLSFSSPTDSPFSPHSPFSDYPSFNKVSRSQPETPSEHLFHHRGSIASFVGMPQRPPSPPTSPISTRAVTPTFSPKSYAPSSPECRYKQTFHRSPLKSSFSEDIGNRQPKKKNIGRDKRHPPLKIDIPVVPNGWTQARKGSQ